MIIPGSTYSIGSCAGGLTPVLRYLGSEEFNRFPLSTENKKRGGGEEAA